MTMRSNPIKKILVVDAIGFQGGSKIATQQILNELPKSNIFIVLTRDASSWQESNVKTIKLRETNYLAKQENGFLYYLRHLSISIQIIIAVIRIGQCNCLLGASGPGVDMSIYITKIMTKLFLRLTIIQLIHGPIATSKSIYHGLLLADIVGYLPNIKQSITDCLMHHTHSEKKEAYFEKPNIVPMHNGLASRYWPSKIQSHVKTANILWAASLLKWKRLDLFTDAVNRLQKKSHFYTHVCYIKPKSCALEQCQVPQANSTQKVYEQPKNLDSIRSGCNIFVSTSYQEPFGLSILEAMAAGLCVVIPADGAYWDSVLTDGINCVKYLPEDSHDLSKKLTYLIDHIHIAHKIGETSYHLAKDYRAGKTYLPLINQISETYTMNKERS